MPEAVAAVEAAAVGRTPMFFVRTNPLPDAVAPTPVKFRDLERL